MKTLKSIGFRAIVLFAIICLWQCKTPPSRTTTTPQTPVTEPEQPPITDPALIPFFERPVISGREGQVLKIQADLTSENYAFFIKNRETQRVFTVRNESEQPGALILHNNLAGNLAQKFVFEKVDGSYYYIRSMTGGHYLSLNDSGELIQDQLETPGPEQDRQKWRLAVGEEPTCFYLQPKSTPEKTLQPTGQSAGAHIQVSDRSDLHLQQWIFKKTTFEGHPDSKEADFAILENCDVIDGFDGGLILPEWRSVGEDFVPNGIDIMPKYTLRILEGKVIRGRPGVSKGDLPICHFTHDFIFFVDPDPPFEYLRGIQNGSKQSGIEVEWECGIAQVWSKDNPAAAVNDTGESFGFYTAGHTRKQVIWNWPTSNDWVHVEGAWIWDRGHPPARTEIHPPRFVAIQRNLPAKYNVSNNPGQYFFATRCDLFANGDGNIMWNNKNLHSYTGRVPMSDKNYTVTFKHLLPHPDPNNQNIKLAYSWERRPGDSYSSNLNDARVVVHQDGTPDIPQPHVEVTIPWADQNRPDNAVFARTLYLYWDDTPSHGIPSDFPMKIVRVGMEKVTILDKKEGNDTDAGEYCLFADIGGNYVFLNEFTNADEVVSEGLGTVFEKEDYALKCYLYTQGNPGRECPDFEFEFNNLFFELCLPIEKEFRFEVSGYERDFMDDLFGELINPYSTCQDLKDYVADLGLLDILGQIQAVTRGGLDDPVGEVERHFPFLDITPGKQSFRGNSRGDVTGDLSFLDDNDPNNSYQVSYHVELLTSLGTGDPCAALKDEVAGIEQRIEGYRTEATRIGNIMKRIDPNNFEQMSVLIKQLTENQKKLDEALEELPGAEARLAECKRNNPGW